MRADQKREAVFNALESRGLKAVLLCGYDDAIIGLLDTDVGGASICYDTAKILKALVKTGMNYDEAVEFFEFNIEGAKFSDGNPTFIDIL